MADDKIVAFDFGITNTDIAIEQDGGIAFHSRPSQYRALLADQASGPPATRLDAGRVIELLEELEQNTEQVGLLAATGGHHQGLPDKINGIQVVKVPEIQAVGDGGRALANGDGPLLVVSAGSGTLCVYTHNGEHSHAGGTAVGGATLVALSRLLAGTAEPREIEALARTGNSSVLDLSLGEVVSGPIGTLAPEATAVNLGKLALGEVTFSPADMAASLINLVGQTLALVAIGAARNHGARRILLGGRLPRLSGLARVVREVCNASDIEVEIPRDGAFISALGALLGTRRGTAGSE